MPCVVRRGLRLTHPTRLVCGSRATWRSASRLHSDHTPSNGGATQRYSILTRGRLRGGGNGQTVRTRRNIFSISCLQMTPGLFAQQERRIVDAATRLATTVHRIPPDPAYPNVPPRALLVGGFVRDMLSGEKSKDLDVEVHGVRLERLEAILEQLYPGLVNTVGRSFGILKIHLGEDIEIDVAIPRRESKTGTGHKGFVVTGDPGMTIEDAARRRDFTVNAMAMDPLTGEILDPFHGREDLDSHVLRVVDSRTFPDDPLRVYRALQLAARFQLHINSETQDLMRRMVERGDLDELAPERVTDEIRKLLLKAERPSLGFELARSLGVIEKKFPELLALADTPQEPEWHPEGDVWIHTLMVIDQATRIARDPARNFSSDERLEIMICAICHDLGKPETTQTIDGRIRSRGHEEAGVERARAFLGRLSFGEHVMRAVIAITRDHLKPGMLSKQLDQGTLTETSYSNAVRKLVKRIYPVSWRVFLAVCEADYRGRSIPGANTEPYSYGNRFSDAVKRHRLDDEPTKPLVQGRDIVALGVPAGPRVGALIEDIERLRDEGTILTREEALAEAKRLIADAA